jgi:RimJ/RimL family protein N-acetyltransferase
MSEARKLIKFRKLQLEDLVLLHEWLNLPHVHEFYDKDKENTVEDVEKRYAPKIKGEKPTDCYFALYEGKPVGYIQKYFVNDWPELGSYLNYDDFVVSVDLFIGNPEFMSKGFGSLMLSEFLNQVVFADLKVSLCMIGPEPSNRRAIKAYEKVGFKHVQTVRIGDEPEMTYIMEVSKHE